MISVAVPDQARKHVGMAIHVFHHIPKCGGTSGRRAFTKWFRVIDDYRAAVSPEATETFLNNKLDLSALDEQCLLRGHFDLPGAHLYQRYPEILSDARYRLITFVRDPLEVAQSYYFYRRATLDAYEFDRLSGQVGALDNYVASIFPCTEENYKAVIDRYFFVGLTECLQESFDILARMLGQERVLLTVENAFPRDEVLTEDEVLRFKQKNKLDYKLYAYCRERFEQFRQAYG